MLVHTLLATIIMMLYCGGEQIYIEGGQLSNTNHHNRGQIFSYLVFFRQTV